VELIRVLLRWPWVAVVALSSVAIVALLFPQQVEATIVELPSFLSSVANTIRDALFVGLALIGVVVAYIVFFED